MLASIAIAEVRHAWSETFDFILHASVQAANGDTLPDSVAGQYERLLRGAGESSVEGKKKADKEGQSIEHGAVLPTKITVFTIANIFQDLNFQDALGALGNFCSSISLPRVGRASRIPTMLHLTTEIRLVCPVSFPARGSSLGTCNRLQRCKHFSIHGAGEKVVEQGVTNQK